MKKRIAIIGAGISGLVIAQKLKNHADVVIYEKSRGVGGRMSTRYADPFYFDHGAQCFTARTEAFKNFLQPLIDCGVVAEWSGKVINLEIGKKETQRLWFETHLVAAPNMNSLCKKLAEGLEIKLSTEVTPLSTKKNNSWILQDKADNFLGEYDWVISTAPPAQTLNLFAQIIPQQNPITDSQMQGCFCLMIGFNRPWDRDWIAAKVRQNPIKWISINSTKPGRNKAVTSIVVHSRGNWADDHIEDDPIEIQKLLTKEFELVTKISATNADYLSLHRWKYAIVEKTNRSGFYVDESSFTAATSDWSATSRIEEVWINANNLADFILNLSRA
jgi:renalase